MTDDRPHTDPATRLVLTKDYADPPDRLAEFLDRVQDVSDENYRLTLTIESDSLGFLQFADEYGEPSESGETSNPSKPAEPEEADEPAETDEADEPDETSKPSKPAEPETETAPLQRFATGDTVASQKEGYGEGTVAKVNEDYGTIVVDFPDGVTRAHSPEELDHVDADAPREERDDDADDDSLAVRVTLTPGTWKFKAASALLHAESPQTAAEIERTFDGTEWEKDRGSLSQMLSELHKQDVADREKRMDSEITPPPFEYHLTDEGRVFVESVESEAVDQGEQTFPDVVDGDANREDTGTPDDAEGEDTDTDADPDDDGEPEPDSVECPDCGKEFPDGKALSGHLSTPFTDCSRDAETDEPDAPAESDESDAPADRVDVDPGDLFTDPDTEEPTGLDALFPEEGTETVDDAGETPDYLDGLDRAMDQTERPTQ